MCFINHVHIDNQEQGQGTAEARIGLAAGIIFARTVLGHLGRAYPTIPIRVILAASEDGITVRFHERREGESWISDDLETYQEESLLVLDS
jgi:hypothetical protein